MSKLYNLLAGLFLICSTIVSAQPVIGTTDFAVVGTVNLVSVSSCVTTKTANTFGWLVSVSSTSNCGLNLSDASAGDGRMQYLVGFGTLTQATFGSNTGSEFALREIAWGVSTPSFANVPFTFVGYKNGLPVPGATLNATSPPLSGFTNSTIVSFTNNLAFREVDDVRLSSGISCSSILALEYITIATPTAPCNSPTLSVTGTSDVLCNGQSNGSATMSATGGSGLTYTWSPSGGNAASAINLTAGVYTLSATNSSCTNIATKTVQIAQPAAIVSATAVTFASCNAGLGSASVTASGGTGALTYSWSVAAATGTAISAVAGLYTVAIKDANNCVSTKTLIILQPSAIAATINVTNVVCNGGTGTASVLTSGGTAPRTFSWSTGTTASSVTNVPAGVYTFTVTDANSCNIVRTATITQPPALVTTTAVTGILCNGGSAGSATITASGGTGAYTYSWSTGGTTSVIATAPAGTYTATVKDASNCTSIKTSVITQPLALTTSTAVTHPACNGGTGSATITASGGTGSLTYSWSAGATTSVVSGMPAGVYTATVTDANNCTSIKTSVITQPLALTTSTSVTHAACNGGTGSATITASGGTGSLTYSWSAGATTSVVSGMAGVYTATVTDANNCTSIKTSVISQPLAITTSTAVTQAACNGGTGSATITASGGTGSLTYSWSAGPTTSVVSGVAGVYTATVTDANNCTSIKTSVITQPLALTTSTAVTQAACNGGTGSATVTASGGTGSLTYSWSAGPTTSVVSGMAGVYTATVTDANNCTSIRSFIITEPAALVTSTAITNAACNGGTGSATLTATGGTGAYTYLWSNTATTSIVAGLTAGAYTGTVTDANNCQSVKTVSITAPASITLTAAAGSPSICSGGASALTANASGGSGTITYTWTSGPASASYTVSPTVATVYTVNATDANNCQRSQTVAVAVAYGPGISVNSGTICAGQSFSIGGSGAVSYTYSGGSALVSPVTTTSYIVTGTGTNGCVNSAGVVSQVTVYALPVIGIGNYTICSGASVTLSPGGANSYTYSGGSVVAPSATTSYSITGTSLEGCISASAAVFSVYVNSLPTITVNSGTICAGQPFTMNPSGASSYSFTGGSGIVSPVITTSYAVTGTGTNGCVSAAAAISDVTVFALPTLTLSNGSICPGNSFTLSPSGASTYTYLNGGPVVSPGITTTYSVIGASSQGCPSGNTVSAVVTVTNTLLISVTGTNIICNGDAALLTANGASTYSWSTNAITSTISVSPSANTSYTVYGSSGTCSNAAVVNVTVNITPTLSISGTNTLCAGESITLSASGAGTYLWSNSNTSASITVSPSASLSYSVVGTNSSNCSAAAFSSVTVYALPAITASNGVICSGSSFTLLPAGAATYTYSGGTAVVSPTLTSSYTITGTSAEGCAASNTAVVSVTVNALPVVSASVTKSNLCFGESTVLNGGGATTYTWSGGVTDGIPFSPGATATYSVSGTDLVTGCTSTNIATQLVTVNPLPTLSVTSTNSLLCAGETATLTVSGATSYSWSGSLSGSAIIVNPLSDATFSVVGTDANACVNTATFVQFVSECTGLNALNASAASFFGLYPNPNTGSFTVELRAATTLVITNALGAVIFHEAMAQGKHSFDLQNQARGIYFVRVIEQGVSHSMKVISQ